MGAGFRIATTLRTNNRRTKKRGENRENPEIRKAHNAALACCLFPLTDTTGSVIAKPAPIAAPVSVGPASHFPTDLHGLHNAAISLLNLPENTPTVIVGDSVHVGNKDFTDFRSRLRQKADMLRMINKRREQTFSNASIRFLEQTSSFKPGQLSDLEILITIIATNCDRETKAQNLPPEEADTLFLQVIDLFINTMKEVISRGPNARTILEQKLFKSQESLKSHLSKFLVSTKGIQGNESTSLADWLRIVFQLKPETHNAAVIQVKGSANDRVALGELDRYIRQLEAGNVPTAPIQDFPSREQYEAWRQRELAIMNGFKRAILLAHPHVRPYYKIILNMCLQHDMTSSHEDNKNGEMELSKTSKAVLNECATRWQLSKDFRDIALMEAFVELYIKNLITINDAAEKLNSMFSHFGQAFTTCRHSDLDYYLNVLKKVDNRIRGDLEGFVALLKGDPVTARSTMNNLIKIIDKLNKDPVWFSYTDASEDKDVKILGILTEALVGRYNALDQAANSSDEVIRMKQMIRGILGDLDKFSTYFPDPILKAKSIRDLAEEQFLKFFAVQLENLRYAFGKDSSMSHIFGTDGIYHEVSNLLTRVDCEKLGIKINTEELFRPFIQEWLGRQDEAWDQWVANACRVDTYEPILAPTTMYSSSVRDIFGFFNDGLSFMTSLTGVTAGKKEEMTITFMRMMCKALESYAGYLKDAEFYDWEENNSDDAINFTPESCIKLNNIVGAMRYLGFIFDELGVNSRGERINPNAKRTDYGGADKIEFDITIVRAYDLQICDFTSSDPFVTFIYRKTPQARTKTIYKNLNPVWNETFNLAHERSRPVEQSFVDFIVYDEDNFSAPDVCGKTTNQKLFLLEGLFEDYLTHELKLPLDPQGSLVIRVKRQGEIADIDFWVRKSLQTLKYAGEAMIRIYCDRIVRYVSASCRRISDTFKSSFFSALSQSSSIQVSETKVEDELRPVLQYLDRNLSLLNESLDRPMLNALLREQYTYLAIGNTSTTNKMSKRAGVSQADLQKEAKAAEIAQEEAERDAPSLICKVIWNELVTQLHTDLNAFGGEKGEGGAKVRAPGAARNPLTDSEKKQVLAMDYCLEYLKAFFYCDIDGRNCGLSLLDLENRKYLDTRVLITTLSA
ncbi:hypothetical protein HDU76_001402 [Blyttiomyces sp. JEL0837]|nr:hypothetical protein HDU76_001402 [Blyttiomyces sp. JEL0837]